MTSPVAYQVAHPFADLSRADLQFVVANIEDVWRANPDKLGAVVVVPFRDSAWTLSSLEQVARAELWRRRHEPLGVRTLYIEGEMTRLHAARPHLRIVDSGSDGAA